MKIHEESRAETHRRSSFLYIRIQQNPTHYAFAAAAGPKRKDQRSWEEWLDHYVEVRDELS